VHNLPSFSDFLSACHQFGLLRGTFAFFFFLAHAWVWWLYEQRVRDAKQQIARVAAENHDYRDRFLELLDNKFGFKSQLNAPPKPLENTKKGGKTK